MKILIIDDERAFIRTLTHYLQSEYEMLGAVSAREGLQLTREWVPDLILLDIKLPDMDGHEACKRLREITRAPIILLSILADTENVIQGFHTGADGYLVKPFPMRELKARIHAILRRTAKGGISLVTPYQDDSLSIDLSNGRVEKNGKRVALSRTEIQLLACLLAKRGQVVSSADLMVALWGSEYTASRHALSLHIGHLRSKVEDDPRHPSYIRNRFGIGYWFHGHDDPEPK